ncbi:MAG: NIPSNAP family protein, partial [Mesorhizobium sp.]
MSLPPNAPPKSSLNASPVVELRQYTLKPGRRDTL